MGKKRDDDDEALIRELQKNEEFKQLLAEEHAKRSKDEGYSNDK